MNTLNQFQQEFTNLIESTREKYVEQYLESRDDVPSFVKCLADELNCSEDEAKIISRVSMNLSLTSKNLPISFDTVKRLYPDREIIGIKSYKTKQGGWITAPKRFNVLDNIHLIEDVIKSLINKGHTAIQLNIGTVDSYVSADYHIDELIDQNKLAKIKKSRFDEPVQG
jgi:hypothetical protein